MLRPTLGSGCVRKIPPLPKLGSSAPVGVKSGDEGLEVVRAGFRPSDGQDAPVGEHLQVLDFPGGFRSRAEVVHRDAVFRRIR